MMFPSLFSGKVTGKSKTTGPVVMNEGGYRPEVYKRALPVWDRTVCKKVCREEKRELHLLKVLQISGVPRKEPEWPHRNISYHFWGVVGAVDMC